MTQRNSIDSIQRLRPADNWREDIPSFSMISVIADRVDECLKNLRNGFSVHLIGLPGSGRSQVFRLVAEKLSLAGVGIIWMRGSRLLAQRPLSSLALAGVLAGGQTAAAPGDTLLKQAVDAFEARVKRPYTVLLVDDAADLDWASAGIIATVRSKRDFPILMASPPSIYHDEVLGELLVTAQPGVEIALDGLLLEQVYHLANTLLDGVLESSATSQIATLSGGLPGLVQAIVAVGRRTGRLALHDGMWRATSGLWDEQLGSVLRPFLTGLDQNEIDSLTQLACSGPIMSLQAEELVGPAMVRKLTQIGLLRFEQGGEISVFPPALAELLRRAGGLADNPHCLAPSSAGTFEPDRGLGVLVGLDAAAFANQACLYWQEKIAECLAEWNQNRVPATALPLLVALRSGAADSEKTNMVLTETERSADDLLALTNFVTLSATYRATWGQDLAGALAELHQHEQDFPESVGYIRACEAHLILICERVPHSTLLELPIASEDPLAEELLRVARIEAMLACGEMVSAAELLADFHPSGERAASATQVFNGLVRVLGDDADGGVEWALTHLRDAMERLEPTIVAGHAYVAALGMAVLGRFSELDSVVEIAFRLVNTNSFQSHYQTGLFLLASTVAAWEGRTDYARSLAVQAISLIPGNGPFPGMLAALQVLSQPTIAAGHLWDQVDDLLDRGYVTSAVYLAVMAVELEPEAARVATVVERGAGAQSRVLQAMSRYIASVAADDVDQLVHVIDELREVCGPLEAMRAGITRALMLRDAGDSEGWLEQAEAAWHEGKGLGRHCGGLFARLIERVDLTPREAEAVGFAAQGRSASEIASTIGVTNRTVEAHLLAAYRKIGVRSRQELQPVISTWLTL